LLHENDSSGVVVHRDNCSHIAEALLDRRVKSRVVHVRWANESSPWDDATYAEHVPLTHLLLEDWPIPVSSTFARSSGKPQCQPAHIEITARDCDGLLSYVTGILAGLGKSIRRSCTETDPNTLIATLAFEVMVEDTDELRRIMERLKECEEVMSVRRFDANEGNAYFPSFRRTRSAEPVQHHATTGQARLIEIVINRNDDVDGVTPVVSGGGGCDTFPSEFARDEDDFDIGYYASRDMLETENPGTDSSLESGESFST
jgi:hypothetical protein